jgi:hypothetical protein
MAKITAKFKLNQDSKWPKYQETCRPMVLESNKYPNETCVAIRVENSYLIFHEGALTYCTDQEYLREAYNFIRYLAEDETATFSGAA